MNGNTVLKDQRYVGRICCGKIDNDIRGRVEFVTLGTSGNYGGIKISAINRKEGVIDSMLLRFSDIFGKKKVNNPNFKDGIVPHIWENRSGMFIIRQQLITDSLSGKLKITLEFFWKRQWTTRRECSR